MSVSPTTAPDDRKPTLLIRAAGEADAEVLAAFYDLPGVAIGDGIGRFQGVDMVRARMAPNDRRRMLLAFDDGVLVGIGSLLRYNGRRSHAGEIGVAVHDDWTGRGIGSALMAALIDLAENWWGLRRIESTPVTTNAASLALHKRFGFEIEGTHRKHLLQNGELVDAHTLARVR